MTFICQGESTVQFLTSATAVKGALTGKRPFTLDDLTQRFRGFAWREKRRCGYLIGSLEAEIYLIGSLEAEGYLIGSLRAGASPPQGCRKEKLFRKQFLTKDRLFSNRRALVLTNEDESIPWCGRDVFVL